MKLCPLTFGKDEGINRHRCLEEDCLWYITVGYDTIGAMGDLNSIQRMPRKECAVVALARQATGGAE